MLAILKKTEQAKSDLSRGTLQEVASDQTPQMQYSVPGIVRWLSEFFTLTEEDQLAAGIHIGNERRCE